MRHSGAGALVGLTVIPGGMIPWMSSTRMVYAQRLHILSAREIEIIGWWPPA